MVAEPFSLLALTTFVVKNAPSWLAALRGTVLEQGREVAIDKIKGVAVSSGEQAVRRLFWLDEKEQLRHLEQALKNAAERGLATFTMLEQRDLYKDIIQTLWQPGPMGEALRREILPLFTVSDTPNLVALSDLYNQHCYYDTTHSDINAAPYLNSFHHARARTVC